MTIAVPTFGAWGNSYPSYFEVLKLFNSLQAQPNEILKTQSSIANEQLINIVSELKSGPAA